MFWPRGRENPALIKISRMFSIQNLRRDISRISGANFSSNTSCRRQRPRVNREKSCLTQKSCPLISSYPRAKAQWKHPSVAEDLHRGWGKPALPWSRPTPAGRGHFATSTSSPCWGVLLIPLTPLEGRSSPSCTSGSFRFAYLHRRDKPNHQSRQSLRALPGGGSS